MRQKSLFDGTVVSIFCFFCTRSDLSAENSFLFMSILSKDLHPSAAAAPFRSAAPLLCGRTVPVYALPPRKAHGHGLFSSHQQLHYTVQKENRQRFSSRWRLWRRWWVLPRPKNSPPGCFCPAGRKAPGTGCSHPTSNFTTLCKKKTASAFLHADGFWRRWWDSNPRARLRTKRFRVVLVTTTSIHLHIVAFTV